MMADLQSGARRLLFLALNRAMGAKVGAPYAEWLRLERAPPAELAALSRERLQRLLRHARATIPFYRERVASPQAELGDFPILRKEHIREHFTALMSPELRGQYESVRRQRGYGWIEVKSGGTTGVPTRVIHDAAFRDQGRASRLYSQRLCGFPFGVPYFRLWGSMAEIERLRDARTQRGMRWLGRETLLNAFCMSPERMSDYLDRIDHARIRHLMAYVDAAGALADFARQQGRRSRPLVSVMACAGTVTAEVRRSIQEAFGARVHNKYGSRDATDMACECEAGGLHIYSHHVHLEVVDDRDRPCPAGETGRLLVTLLGNVAFPMIRYDIGDTAAMRPGACPCGRAFPLLDRLEGRTVEFLRSTRGGYVSPVYLRHLIGVAHNPGFIRRFQVVQETERGFTLTLELASSVEASAYGAAEQAIRHGLMAALGPDAQLEISRTEALPVPASGKFLYTVNRSGGGTP